MVPNLRPAFAERCGMVHPPGATGHISPKRMNRPSGSPARVSRRTPASIFYAPYNAPRGSTILAAFAAKPIVNDEIIHPIILVHDPFPGKVCSRAWTMP